MKRIMMLLISCLLIGCNMPEEESEQEESLSVRIVLETLNESAGEAFVYLEGPDGNYVTGARVMIVGGSGVSQLDFDLDRGCYAGEIPVTAGGEYTVQVQSRLLSNTFTQGLTHRVVSESPDLILFKDSGGNSALEGTALIEGREIQMAWTESDSATVYQIRLYKSGSLIHLESTSESTALLPSETLGGSGSYTCQISAQYISGDPLLSRTNYYSYSEKSGSSLYFTVE